MSVQRYPHMVSLYKGEGRILVVPVVNHIGGYSIKTSWFINVKNVMSSIDIGNSLLEAATFVRNSPISTLTPKEREAGEAWKKNSKYKNWLSFWKHNNCAHFFINADGSYEIYSTQRSEEKKGGYGGIIKSIELPSLATAQEIGQAVIDVFEAAEEYYGTKPASVSYPPKQLELMDGSILTVDAPQDKHFEDCEDAGAAEIYQCYSYKSNESADSSADFFLGIAPELDCSLEEESIRFAWEEIYGKAENFEVKECECGIFKLCVEMRNKEKHKISYLLQMEEALLLECGMDVHLPNRRKKLDEKLVRLFEEFVMSCSMNL